ncbi:MAG: protein-L-isoaspartate(D-aspartate) O-methyltransferase [Kiloniellales bacterium]
MTLAARKIRLVMQLRRAGIGDTAVLSAIERIPRETFVPPLFHDQAYEDRALPLARGQTLSAPSVVATMTAALRADRRMKVLEIGTGSGYQTAVLSRLCRRVYTIERIGELLDGAEQRFRALRLHNITTRLGDGSEGWPAQAPFQRIVATAAATDLPQPLIAQLTPGGILIVPVGRSGGRQELLRITRAADGNPTNDRIDSLGAVKFVPLVGVAGAQQAPAIASARPGPIRSSLA